MIRRQAAIGAALTIAVGLASRRFRLGFFLWDKSLGDVLYTVMIYFFIALVRPTWRPLRLGACALALSLAVELFQLTGFVERMPRIVQIALGTNFSGHDIACYVVGAATVTIADAFWLRPDP